MTSVTQGAAVVAGTALATTLVMLPASSADEPSDPVLGLVGQLLAPPPPAPVSTATAAAASGRAWAPDGILRRGCRDYPYRYEISTPTDEWTLEVFLRDRDGHNLASGTFISDSDPKARASRFRFCKFSTRAGWFTIRSLVHWYDADGTGHRQWLDQTRFRLRRPR
jgi:hypothetical protein